MTNVIVISFSEIDYAGDAQSLSYRFLSSATNQKTERYGGSVDNRVHNALIADVVSIAVGLEATGKTARVKFVRNL
jgi:2,4-dienoyl-CoA reductase-like NADH-dependent reductase (Old Yellow Enzyme family)